MRKILFHVSRDMFPQVKERYPYVYLEHGRLEIDDSSVKWISAEGYVVRLPVATIGSLFLGPGTSVTHAAIHAIGLSGCTVCWVGEESLSFYAYGMPPTADTEPLYRQGRLAFDPITRVEVARRMFSLRFPSVDLKDKSLQTMMGMEGVRVRKLYADLSKKYGVEWQRRTYVPGKPAQSDPANRTLTFLNQLLYGVCTSSILALGYSPRIGFIHSGSPMPFVYDVADLYKSELTIDLALKLVSDKVDVCDRHVLIDAFCERLVERKVLETFAVTVNDLLKAKGDG